MEEVDYCGMRIIRGNPQGMTSPIVRLEKVLSFAEALCYYRR